MKVRRSLLPLLLTLVMALLAACGGATPTQQADQPTAAPAPAAATAAPAPTAAPAATAAEAATSAPAATAAGEPSPVPTATPGISTVGTGSTKITWWHIS